MRVIVDTWKGYRVMSVADYVELALNEDRQDVAEEAQANALSAHAAIGRLVERLVDSRILSMDDAKYVAGDGYRVEAAP